MEGCEVALEADELSEGKVNGEIKEVKKSSDRSVTVPRQNSVDDPSDEELIHQDPGRTSDLEEDLNDEESTSDRVNGQVSEEESTQESEDLVSEKQQDADEAQDGKQEPEEIIEEIVEEIEIIEERQEVSEGAKKSSQNKEEAETPEEEETVVEKKKIKYVEEEIDDLDFSHGPDSPEPDVIVEEEEEEEESGELDSQLPETEEDSSAELIEVKQDAETVVEDSYQQEESAEDSVREQEKRDLVDEELKTKESPQIVRKPEGTPAKGRRETKDTAKDEVDFERVVHRRRSSTENFQKLKDRFSSSELQVEENNKRNADKQKRRSLESETAQSLSTMSEGKKRFEGTSEKCTQCNKTVYPMEKMEVAGRVLHKTCFKCCKCNSQLNIGRFSIGGKDMYCMTHYKQAFREKGTYDVFTPDNPCKGKWENKA